MMDSGVATPSSIWRHDLSRRGSALHSRLASVLRLLLVLGAISLVAPSTAQGSDWFLLPWLRVAGGSESAIIVDPAGAAIVVPGGEFLDVAPTLVLRRPGDGRINFELGTRATLERFFNDVDRTLYSQVVWADLTRSLGPRTRFRASLSGNYFDDSEQDTLRRINGGGEFGLAWSTRRWFVEGFAGGHRVNYSNVDVLDASGSLSTYRETRWSAGAIASAALSRAAMVRLSVRGQATSSIDPDFDSVALLTDLGFRWSLWTDFRVLANYGRQDRSFSNRVAGLDSDEYQQWGVGLSYFWWKDNSLTLRWSEGRFVDTLDVSSPTDRLELALNLGPSVFGLPTPVQQFGMESLERWRRGPDADRQNTDGVLFRFYSGSASSVDLAGDFNRWGRDRQSLRALGDGWWELRIPLPPGRYQYVYMVDGVATTPPESTITVDDGFGGRNGSLEVLP
ncbi:hypothetical protein DRQ32_05955 [bacterium]|nr:MAG: hypothetical protein DRQ32_05955 [bacterium]